jgi:hypothetical protein
MDRNTTSTENTTNLQQEQRQKQVLDQWKLLNENIKQIQTIWENIEKGENNITTLQKQLEELQKDISSLDFINKEILQQKVKNDFESLKKTQEIIVNFNNSYKNVVTRNNMSPNQSSPLKTILTPQDILNLNKLNSIVLPFSIFLHGKKHAIGELKQLISSVLLGWNDVKISWQWRKAYSWAPIELKVIFKPPVSTTTTTTTETLPTTTLQKITNELEIWMPISGIKNIEDNCPLFELRYDYNKILDEFSSTEGIKIGELLYKGEWILVMTTSGIYVVKAEVGARSNDADDKIWLPPWCASEKRTLYKYNNDANKSYTKFYFKKSEKTNTKSRYCNIEFYIDDVKIHHVAKSFLDDDFPRILELSEKGSLLTKVSDETFELW